MQVKGGVFKLLLFLVLVAATSGAVAKPKPSSLPSVASPASGSKGKTNAFPAFANWAVEAKKWAQKAKVVVSTAPRPIKLSKEFSAAEVEWANALKLVYDALSAYAIQKDRVLYNVQNLNDWGQKGKTQGLKGQINEANLAKFLDALQKTSPFPQKMSSNDFLKILKNGGDSSTKTTTTTTPTRFEELNSLIGAALDEDAQCQFDPAANSIVVQGHSILLSKVLTSDCLKKGTSSLSPSLVLIASHTLFIDKAVVGSSVNSLGLNVYAYAPNWNNMIGKTVSFNLDGAKGDSYTAEEAPRLGEAGKAGKPGKNGGNFVGVGNSFTGGAPGVSTKGGAGGDGQAGGNGVPGVNGALVAVENLVVQVKKSITMSKKIIVDIKSEFGCEGKGFLNEGLDQKWECSGGVPTDGKPGGNGGKAGLGGLGGSIVFLNGDQKLEKQTGGQGLPGQPGKGGIGGKGGDRKIRTFVISTTKDPKVTAEEKKQGWWFRNVDEKEDVCSTCEGKRGASGKDGIEGTPQAPTVNEFYIKYLPLFGILARQKLADLPALFYPQLQRLFNDPKFMKSSSKSSSSTSTSLASLADLVTLIDLNSDLHLLRAQFSYFHELKVMELQWPGLLEKDPLSIQFVLVPSYNALLRHVLDKGKTMGSLKDAATKKYLQGLRYLYTAAFSRSRQQPSGMDSALVTDVEKYVASILQNFKTLQSSVVDRKKLQVIQETKEAYSKEIDAKFQEAENIIKNTLQKRIEQAETALDGITATILQEIQNLQGQGFKAEKELEEARKKLQGQMYARLFFGTLKTATAIAKCAGPIGQLAGGVVDQASGLAVSAILGQPGELKSFKIPEALLSGDKEFIDYFNSEKKAYDALTTEQMHAAGSTLDGMPKIDPKVDKELAETTQDINKLAKELNAIKLRPETPAGAAPTNNIEALAALTKTEEDAEKVKKEAAKKLQDRLKFLEKKKADLAKLGKTKQDAIVKQLEQVQTYATTALGIVTVGVGVYKTYKEDKTALAEMGKSIIVIQENLDNLETKFNSVNANLTKSLTVMRKDVTATMDGLKNKSPVALEISKSDIQKNLKKLQSALSSSFTKGTAAEGTVKESFDALSETFDILIKVYDRMNEYEGQAKLATFIADINSAGFIQPDATTELGRAVQDVELITQANVIRSQYDLSIKSFKMFQFPFVIDFLEKMTVPEDVLQDLGGISKSDDSTFYANQPSVPTESLVDRILGDISKRLVDLNTKIEASISSVIPSDELTAVNVPFDDEEDSAGPFFTWTSAEYGDDIKRLLKLEPISLLADIKQKTNVTIKDGVKFSRVELHFIPKSTSADDQAVVTKLREKLKGYVVHLTHSGHNYYRYGSQVYSTMIKQLPMFFNYVGKRGDPVTAPNNVYSKLLKSPPCLSPFTLWTIQLKKIKQGAPDPELEKAAAAVDLQLAGEGSLVTGTRKPELLRLEQYYDRVEL